MVKENCHEDMFWNPTTVHSDRNCVYVQTHFPKQHSVLQCAGCKKDILCWRVSDGAGETGLASWLGQLWNGTESHN